ncbi:hypothetical protein ICN18_06965 [Polynucleobacter sp. Ross1-W9]|uniref:hypothetical protein n=1 Tax=Polynucleobacter parvulilacunae TaxID=1855631 RepID=UPI001C0B7CE1|nr:hypothetical protein [Polynucleobacter parvulilacunae]MBU3557366.1 hypothetical protein [Polynucleobacter parvulilacunae]
MSFTSFCGRHPLATLLTFSLLVCGSAALAGTKIQLNIDDSVQANSKNPHQIPTHMDPKSESLAEEIRLIKYEVSEVALEVEESIHSVAMRDIHGQSHPILDYTTGTSN